MIGQSLPQMASTSAANAVEENGMAMLEVNPVPLNSIGIAFTVGTWVLLLAVNAWCLYKILYQPQPKLHPAEVGEPAPSGPDEEELGSSKAKASKSTEKSAA